MDYSNICLIYYTEIQPYISELKHLIQMRQQKAPKPFWFFGLEQSPEVSLKKIFTSGLGLDIMVILIRVVVNHLSVPSLVVFNTPTPVQAE